MLMSLVIYQKKLQQTVQDKSGILTPNGINSLEKITLGGLDQWILIRGWDKSNPVLLFLHGGPGAPLFTYARDIGVRARLEQHVVVVYWEQRGTGKSFFHSIPKESMTIDQFVFDTCELAEMLKNRFGKQKIVLVGRSWGSLIGLLAVQQQPELFSAYVGIGQMIYPLQNDSLSFEQTLEMAKKIGDKKAIKELLEIGYPPYDYKELFIQRRWLTAFYHQFMSKKFDRKRPNYWKRLLSTPEYTLFDIFKMGQDPFFSIKHLWNNDLYKINLFEQVPLLDIPVWFLAGRYDYFTPSELVERYYQDVKAPHGKSLVWFEESGHEPELQEPEKFQRFMINHVLTKIKYRKNGLSVVYRSRMY